MLPVSRDEETRETRRLPWHTRASAEGRDERERVGGGSGDRHCVHRLPECVRAFVCDSASLGLHALAASESGGTHEETREEMRLMAHSSCPGE